MSEVIKAKTKRNNYFGRKRQRQYTLDVNFRGFLCSCNNREKECVRESYNLLNKYADILYPKEEAPTTTAAPTDVSDDLASELATLKAEKTEPKRFQVVESGAKNFLFVRTTLENPVELAEKIVTDIDALKSQQTRFLLRLVPIEITCKAIVADIEKAFQPLALKYFKDSPRVFSIVFNHRNNNSISKDEVIKNVADIVAKTRGDHKVNLKEAEVSIIIEVIKGIALIGVVPNFFKFKKYNLLALSDQESETEVVQVKTEVDSKTEGDPIKDP